MAARLSPLLLALVVAGCLSSPLRPDAVPAAALPTLVDGGAVAWHPSGASVSSGSLALALPVGEERPIGLSAFEPSIGVDPSGWVVMDARVEGAAGEHVRASSDQGATWRDIGPTLASGVSNPPESDDPFLYVDAVTGRIFEVMLQGTQCAWVTFSDDHGATWTTKPLDCGLPPGVHDHQSVVAAPSRGSASSYQGRLVHYCVNEVAVTSCAMSADGGATFGALHPIMPSVAGDPPGFCGGTTGHVKADHAGRVFVGQVRCGVPTVVASEDDGQTWSIHALQGESGRGHDLEVAADAEDGLYAVWMGSDGLPHLARSLDHGATWGPSIVVSPPDVARAEYVVIVAGAAGKVAVGFLGSLRGDPSPAPTHAFLSIVPDAGADDPLVLTAMVDRPANPVAHGCESGCSGIGDFIDLALAPDGRPWMALVDLCNAGCSAQGPDGSKEAAAGTLLSGPSLWGGDLVPLAPLPP
jgi:hypothetical protein